MSLMRGSLAITAVLLTLTTCAKAPQHQQFDVCEAIRRAPELLGKPVTLTGWFGSIGLGTYAIGSRDCPQTLLEPRFSADLIVQSEGVGQQDTQELRDALSIGSAAPSFYGSFLGTLRRRTGHVQSGPVPLDAAPNLDEMPYILEIKQVKGVRFERPAFIEEPPPAPTG